MNWRSIGVRLAIWYTVVLLSGLTENLGDFVTVRPRHVSVGIGSSYKRSDQQRVLRQELRKDNYFGRGQQHQADRDERRQNWVFAA
jgi:hypothetical protein